MTSKLSQDILDQISDIVEEELVRKNIFYTRDGTRFNVKPENVSNLLEAQLNANKQLISEGVITFDMILKELM